MSSEEAKTDLRPYRRIVTAALADLDLLFSIDKTDDTTAWALHFTGNDGAPVTVTLFLGQDLMVVAMHDAGELRDVANALPLLKANALLGTAKIALGANDHLFVWADTPMHSVSSDALSQMIGAVLTGADKVREIVAERE